MKKRLREDSRGLWSMYFLSIAISFGLVYVAVRVNERIHSGSPATRPDSERDLPKAER